MYNPVHLKLILVFGNFSNLELNFRINQRNSLFLYKMSSLCSLYPPPLSKQTLSKETQRGKVVLWKKPK